MIIVKLFKQKQTGLVCVCACEKKVLYDLQIFEL